MNIFSKDKEIIFKLTNAVLLLWFIGALVFAAGSTISLVVKEPKLTYEEYEIVNCKWINADNEEVKEENCRNQYDAMTISDKNDNYYKRVTLYTSLANVLIVGSVLVIINRKK